MVWIGEREIKMQRGWVVEYHDATVVCEDEMSWTKLPNKKDIKRVLLKWEDRIWSLENKENYIVPKTRGYMDVNSTGVSSQGIDSRAIGYYDTEANCKVLYRVDETTGKMNIETEPF